MFRGISHHILPNRFILHAKINEDILPALPDPGVNVPVKPDTFRPEVAHLPVEAFYEFCRRNARFGEAVLNDLF